MRLGKQPRSLIQIKEGSVNSLNKTLWLATAAATALASNSAQAFDPANLTMRARAAYLEPVNQNDAIAAFAVPSDSINVQKKMTADIDLEYAASDALGIELQVLIPQRHRVTATQSLQGNNLDLGTISLLPLSLTAKYYLGSETFRPYVGGGFNYTAFTDNTLSAPGAGSLDVRRSSFGGVLQAGFDYRLNERWLVSVDARKVWMDTSISSAGTRLTSMTIDPWIWGAGVGYRFGQ